MLTAKAKLIHRFSFYLLFSLWMCCGLILAEAPDTWTFVSIPDFTNADLGTLAGQPGYPDGLIDSTTAGFEATLAFYLDAIQAENPDLVLVAGDLVEGEWHHDVTGRNIFGTYGTHADRQSALNNAANCYYTQWLDRFTSRGLDVFPAVGDHDIGDNNWPTGSDRSRLVPDFKQAFAGFFTLDTEGNHRFPLRPVGTPYEDTSYAFQNKNILFVTVDVWRQDDPYVKLDNRTGSVVATMDGDHLAWLDSLLTQADNDPTIDHVIVQAHSPVLTPVRLRGTSELYLRDYDGTTNAADADQGAKTDFWQTLAAHDVDFFFAGEVHHNTLSIADGVIQIVHDGIPFTTGNYLLGTVTGKKIDFQIKHVELSSGPERFWQTVSNGKSEMLVTGPSWETSSTATYDKTSGTKVLSNMTGELIPYGTNDGSIEGAPFDLNWDFQSPDINGTDVLSGITSWQTLRSDNQGYFDDKGSEARVPGPANNQVIRLRSDNDTGTIFQTNIPYPCTAGQSLRLSLNASEVYWYNETAGNQIRISLKTSDLSEFWFTTVDLDGTHDGSDSDWTAAQTFEFIIDAYTLMAAGLSEGDHVMLEIESIGNVNWVDNIDLSCRQSLWFDVAGPDSNEPDGIVNLYDLISFAEQWLDCRLIPAAACY